jgi:hypothetical protein
MNHVIFFSLITLLNSSFLLAQDTKIDALTKRIEQLEVQQEELLVDSAENTPKVNSFLHDHLTLGGFFEPAYTVLEGPDTKFQAANSSNTLGINISAEFSNSLHFVSQILTGLSFPVENPQNDPRAVTFNQSATRRFGTLNFGAILSQGYLDFSFENHVTIQGGMGYVPFGSAPQQRELVLFVRRGGPQILRTTELFSPLWSGFHLFQTFDIPGKKKWGYNVYSFTRLEDARSPGLGGRFWWGRDNENFITGLSAQSAKYDGRIEESLGYDVKLYLKDFVLTAEYAIHLREKESPWTFYIEPSLFIYQEEVLVYTFLDFAQSSMNKTVTLADPYQKYEYGTGINWLPTSYTRLRAGFTYNDYVYGHSKVMGQNRDYLSLDLSAGVAF